MPKPILTPDDLSVRDKGILDAFASGTSRKALAEQHKLTPERIGQILNRPASIAYLAQQGGALKAQLFAKVGGEILTRAEWGGMKLTDLIAIWKAAMPQEITVNQTVVVRDEAKRIAAELGLSVDDVLAEAATIIAGAR